MDPRTTTEAGRGPDSRAREPTSDPFPVAEALRLIRFREGMTQTAASRRDGAPDFRTLSHWETRRKLPSLRLLHRYLQALGLDFGDLQQALDLVSGRAAEVHEGLACRLAGVERRLSELERRRLSSSEASP